MITYGIYINNNRLITYSKIPTFIMELLHYQATLLNMMIPIISNILKSVLCGDLTPWFLIKSIDSPTNDLTSLPNEEEELVQPPQINEYNNEWISLLKTSKLKSTDTVTPISTYRTNSFDILITNDDIKEDDKREAFKIR